MLNPPFIFIGPSATSKTRSSTVPLTAHGALQSSRGPGALQSGTRGPGAGSGAPALPSKSAAADNVPAASHSSSHNPGLAVAIGTLLGLFLLAIAAFIVFRGCGRLRARRRYNAESRSLIDPADSFAATQSSAAGETPATRDMHMAEGAAPAVPPREAYVYGAPHLGRGEVAPPAYEDGTRKWIVHSAKE